MDIFLAAAKMSNKTLIMGHCCVFNVFLVLFVQKKRLYLKHSSKISLFDSYSKLFTFLGFNQSEIHII